MEKKLFSVICVGILLLIFGLLCLQDKNEKQRAIKRCGGEDNIVEHYTKDGDVYWTCK